MRHNTHSNLESRQTQATQESGSHRFQKECCLDEIANQLASMMRALTKREFQINNILALKPNTLPACATTVLCFRHRLYLPANIGIFKQYAQNRAWYMLSALACASLFLTNAFPTVHGKQDYFAAAAQTGADPCRRNLFAILEYIRAINHARQHWPGMHGILGLALRHELQRIRKKTNGPELLLLRALDGANSAPHIQNLRATAMTLRNCFDTANSLDHFSRDPLIKIYPAINARLLKPPAFLPDFTYQVHAFKTENESFPISFTKAASKHSHQKIIAQEHGNFMQPARRTSVLPPPAHTDFIYDEWDFQHNAYRHAWCRVRAIQAEPAAKSALPQPPRDQLTAVCSTFERLKPTLPRLEKFLENGDRINEDRLVEHIVERRRQPSRPVRFYDKPITKQRDVAVLILLDVSGSTARPLQGHANTLELEQLSALLLGAGLAAIGDSFAIAGFNSNGRDACVFYIFKNFSEPWNGTTRAKIDAATPSNSTRIGPALRHAGRLLAQQPCRQRIILLITDGKPTDHDYDPDTGYAQRDIRMACEENIRNNIHTFAISTAANSSSDMDAMFPKRRFLIIDNIKRLPTLLPRLYLHLTV